PVVLTSSTSGKPSTSLRPSPTQRCFKFETRWECS
ncbi:unnamed protein product, partial [Allacma fusca]